MYKNYLVQHSDRDVHGITLFLFIWETIAVRTLNSSRVSRGNVNFLHRSVEIVLFLLNLHRFRFTGLFKLATTRTGPRHGLPTVSNEKKIKFGWNQTYVTSLSTIATVTPASPGIPDDFDSLARNSLLSTKTTSKIISRLGNSIILLNIFIRLPIRIIERLQTLFTLTNLPPNFVKNTSMNVHIIRHQTVTVSSKI